MVSTVRLLLPRGKPCSTLNGLQPAGSASSSSPNTIFVYLLGSPYKDIVPFPGIAPPKFIKTNLIALPILAPAGNSGDGPRQPYPLLSRICLTIGPFTMTKGVGEP